MSPWGYQQFSRAFQEVQRVERTLREVSKQFRGIPESSGAFQSDLTGISGDSKGFHECLRGSQPISGGSKRLQKCFWGILEDEKGVSDEPSTSGDTMRSLRRFWGSEGCFRKIKGSQKVPREIRGVSVGLGALQALLRGFQKAPGRLSDDSGAFKEISGSFRVI